MSSQGELPRQRRFRRVQVVLVGVSRRHRTRGERVTVAHEQVGDGFVHTRSTEPESAVCKRIRRQRRCDDNAVGPLGQIRRGVAVHRADGQETVLEQNHSGRRFVTRGVIPVGRHDESAADVQRGAAHGDRAVGRNRRWPVDEPLGRREDVEDGARDQADYRRLGSCGVAWREPPRLPSSTGARSWHRRWGWDPWLPHRAEVRSDRLPPVPSPEQWIRIVWLPGGSTPPRRRSAISCRRARLLPPRRQSRSPARDRRCQRVWPPLRRSDGSAQTPPGGAPVARRCAHPRCRYPLAPCRASPVRSASCRWSSASCRWSSAPAPCRAWPTRMTSHRRSWTRNRCQRPQRLLPRALPPIPLR